MRHRRRLQRPRRPHGRRPRSATVIGSGDLQTVPIFAGGQMIMKARPTISFVEIGPKHRPSWELVRLSPITNTVPLGTSRPACVSMPCTLPSPQLAVGRRQSVHVGLVERRPLMATWPSMIEIRSPGRPITRLIRSLISSDGLGRRPLEHDDVAAVDVVEAGSELVDEHPVVLHQRRAHRRRRDVERLEQERLDHERDHDRADDDRDPLDRVLRTPDGASCPPSVVLVLASSSDGGRPDAVGGASADRRRRSRGESVLDRTALPRLTRAPGERALGGRAQRTRSRRPTLARRSVRSDATAGESQSCVAIAGEHPSGGVGGDVGTAEPVVELDDLAVGSEPQAAAARATAVPVTGRQGHPAPSRLVWSCIGRSSSTSTGYASSDPAGGRRQPSATRGSSSPSNVNTLPAVRLAAGRTSCRARRPTACGRCGTPARPARCGSSRGRTSGRAR